MADAAPNSLDLFLKTNIQTAITDGSWLEVRPLNSIEEAAPVDFHVDGTSENFIDLSETYLKVKFESQPLMEMQDMVKETWLHQLTCCFKACGQN